MIDFTLFIMVFWIKGAIALGVICFGLYVTLGALTVSYYTLKSLLTTNKD